MLLPAAKGAKGNFICDIKVSIKCLGDSEELFCHLKK